MNIGIIGSGKMGSALGKIWANNGHQILFSHSRDLEKLKSLAKSVGANAQAGTPAEAARFGEVIMLAVPYVALHEVLQASGSLEDKVVITCVSGLKPDFEGKTIGLPTELKTSVAEQIAELIPRAKVVEAFNTTFAEILQAESRQFDSQQPSLFYCGDDKSAKAIVVELIKECGYEAVDAGPLIKARALETFATVWVQMAAVGGMFPNVALKLLQA
jgi:8-hydroxy-5-deazaflavin:NADPH oxidoreductase